MTYSDNPIRDAERHEEELEEARYICCDECGEHIYVGDTVYEYDGDWFCSEECLMSYIGVDEHFLEEDELE